MTYIVKIGESGYFNSNSVPDGYILAPSPTPINPIWDDSIGNIRDKNKAELLEDAKEKKKAHILREDIEKPSAAVLVAYDEIDAKATKEEVEAYEVSA